MLFCAPPSFAQKVHVGKYTFPKDNSIYYGELVGGKPNGKGKTTFKTGDTYEGEYVNGLRQGYGVYTFTDGEKYEGNWYQDHQHGDGVYYFVDNNWKKYDGVWYIDYMQGDGTMYYTNGDIYIGEWHEDKRNGQGKYIYSSGEVYVGSWANDKKNGKGIFTNKKGINIECVWENDILIYPSIQKDIDIAKNKEGSRFDNENKSTQIVIQMEKDGGIYKIPCLVNGAKMKMFFDTGASTVSLSMSMANYLYENDYLKKEDIIGSGMTQTADGSIVDNIIINIRDIEISGLHIENITATVVEAQDAPLLLGQSAIQQLGKISIDGNLLIIHNENNRLSGGEVLSVAGVKFGDSYQYCSKVLKERFDFMRFNGNGKGIFIDGNMQHFMIGGIELSQAAFNFNNNKLYNATLYRSFYNFSDAKKFFDKVINIYSQKYKDIYHITDYEEFVKKFSGTDKSEYVIKGKTHVCQFRNSTMDNWNRKYYPISVVLTHGEKPTVSGWQNHPNYWVQIWYIPLMAIDATVDDDI